MRNIFCALTFAEYSALVNLEVDIGFVNDPAVRKRLLAAMHAIRELGLDRAGDLCRESLENSSSFFTRKNVCYVQKAPDTGGCVHSSVAAIETVTKCALRFRYKAGRSHFLLIVRRSSKILSQYNVYGTTMSNNLDTCLKS